MNTHMWTHPFTLKHLTALQQELGYHIIQPISKKLACGDVGVGAMAEPAHIVSMCKQVLYSPSSN
jgi:phosphopantothenoylcysteine decarboxylase